jgi:galactose mutarotase-like enzyme
MQQTMTVTQTDDQITVETKLILPDNERILKDTYTLDGKEHDFTPAAPLNAPPNALPGKGKRTVTWLSNAMGMLVTDVITNETPQGPTTLQVARKWSINSDGALTITNFIDAPNGSYETKRVFTKK